MARTLSLLRPDASSSAQAAGRAYGTLRDLISFGFAAVTATRDADLSLLRADAYRALLALQSEADADLAELQKQIAAGLPNANAYLAAVFNFQATAANVIDFLIKNRLVSAPVHARPWEMIDKEGNVFNAYAVMNMAITMGLYQIGPGGAGTVLPGTDATFDPLDEPNLLNKPPHVPTSPRRAPPSPPRTPRFPHLPTPGMLGNGGLGPGFPDPSGFGFPGGEGAGVGRAGSRSWLGSGLVGGDPGDVGLGGFGKGHSGYGPVPGGGGGPGTGPGYAPTGGRGSGSGSSGGGYGGSDFQGGFGGGGNFYSGSAGAGAGASVGGAAGANVGSGASARPDVITGADSAPSKGDGGGADVITGADPPPTKNGGGGGGGGGDGEQHQDVLGESLEPGGPPAAPPNPPPGGGGDSGGSGTDSGGSGTESGYSGEDLFPIDLVGSNPQQTQSVDPGGGSTPNPDDPEGGGESPRVHKGMGGGPKHDFRNPPPLPHPPTGVSAATGPFAGWRTSGGGDDWGGNPHENPDPEDSGSGGINPAALAANNTNPDDVPLPSIPSDAGAAQDEFWGGNNPHYMPYLGAAWTPFANVAPMKKASTASRVIVRAGQARFR